MALNNTSTCLLNQRPPPPPSMFYEYLNMLLHSMHIGCAMWACSIAIVWKSVAVTLFSKVVFSLHFNGKKIAALFSSVQLSPLTEWVTGNDSAGVVFQSFRQEALVSSSGMGRDVHSLMLSFQHFLCPPRHCPPSEVPWRMVSVRLLWCVTCLNRASFSFDTLTNSSCCL